MLLAETLGDAFRRLADDFEAPSECAPKIFVAEERIAIDRLTPPYSDSVRMWRRSSRGSKDIGGLGQNVRPDMRAEPFYRHELDLGRQHFLEEVGEVEETVVRLLAGRKLHQEIYVAARAPFVPCNRAEQRQAMDAHIEDAVADRVDPHRNLVSRQATCHVYSV